MADQAEAATDAAKRSAKSAEMMVQIESLPTVWGRIGSKSGGGHQGAETELIVQNVGRGVALDVSASILFSDGSFVDPRTMARELEPTTGRASQQIRMTTAQHKQIGAGEFSVVCDFNDAAGRRYQTRGRGTSAEVVEILSGGEERSVFRE